MNRIDQYISDVMKNVFASADRKEQFASDLRVHIAERVESGETEIEVLKKMGDPVDVAGEFMAETDLKYAGFWERFLAYILDIHICMGVAGVIFLFIYYIPHSLIRNVVHTPIIMLPSCEGAIPATIFQIILLIFMGLSMTGIILFYFPAMEALFGWTVGKWLLRLRVIRESVQKVNLGQAIMRRLSMYFDFLAIDALFIPFTQKKQRAFDLIAKTVVIRETWIRWTWIRIALIVGVLIVFPLTISCLLHSKIFSMRWIWCDPAAFSIESIIKETLVLILRGSVL